MANFGDLYDSSYGNEFGFVSSNLELDLNVVVRVLWVFASKFFVFGRNHNSQWLWKVMRQ